MTRSRTGLYRCIRRLSGFYGAVFDVSFVDMQLIRTEVRYIHEAIVGGQCGRMNVRFLLPLGIGSVARVLNAVGGCAQRPVRFDRQYGQATPPP